MILPKACNYMYMYLKSTSNCLTIFATNVKIVKIIMLKYVIQNIEHSSHKYIHTHHTHHTH